MKTGYVLGGLLLALQSAAQSGPAFTAAQSVGTVPSGGSIQVRAAAAAPGGGVYVTGGFIGTASFGATTLTAVPGGEADLFVARLDAAGHYQWAVRAGGARAETGTGLALDNSGNVLVVGEFTSTQASFGTTTLAHPYCGGCPMIVVAKLSAAGAWQWVRQSTETSNSGYETATAVATDATGAVYLTGTFQRRDLVLGATTLTNRLSSLTTTATGPPDLFVAKLTAAGSWQWAVSGGGTGRDESTSLALDAARNVYVAGYSESSTATFGPTTLTRSDTANALVLKLTPDGTWLRATPGGSTGYTTAYGLAVTAGGEAYVGGSFDLTTTFGPATLFTAGQSDAYVARLDAAGTWAWAQRSGGTGYDQVSGLATDAGGNVYVTGDFDSAVLDAGPTTLTNTAAGLPDVFAGRLDAQGSWQWALAAGGSGLDVARAVVPDYQGGLYLLGNYESQFMIFGGYGIAGSGGQYSLLGYLARLSGAALLTQATSPGSAFGLHPNPSTGAVWVRGLPAGQLVELYALTGQLVGAARVPAQPTTALALPAGLAPGLYLARCGSLAARLEIR